MSSVVLVAGALRCEVEPPGIRVTCVQGSGVRTGRRTWPRYRVGMTARTLPTMRALLPSTVFRRPFARAFGLAK